MPVLLHINHSYPCIMPVLLHINHNYPCIMPVLLHINPSYPCIIPLLLPINLSTANVNLKVSSYRHRAKPSIYNSLNTLRPRQNGRRFPDDILKRIFLNENCLILIKISLKFVPPGLINNIPALVQIMAWRRPGDKPLSEPMMVSLLTHICITRPHWVKAATLYGTIYCIDGKWFVWNAIEVEYFNDMCIRTDHF